MATAPQPVTTMADLRSRVQLPTLRRNGISSPQDPIAEAMYIGRQAVAQRMVDRTVTDLEAEKIKSENERLKAEIERDKLAAERQGSSAASDGFRDFILGQLERVNAQLADTQKALTEQQAAAMQDRISMLSSELAELQRSRVERPEPPNVVAATRQALEDARALAEMLAPSPTPPPVARPDDPTARAWELRAKLDHELRMKQLDAEERRRDRESEGKIEIEKERLRIEQEQAAQMQRFLTDTGPKILEVGQNIVNLFTSRAQGATGVAGGAAAGVAAGQSVQQIPAGILSFPCQQCGQSVMYRPEFSHAGCFACGAQYQLQPDKPAPSEGPHGEEAASGAGDEEEGQRPSSPRAGGLDIH